MNATRAKTRSVHAAGGFSFIEILVAIGIIGATLIIFQAVLSGSFLSRDAKDESVARAIASSELESLRALGYAALPASGPFSAGELARLPAGAGAVAVSSYETEVKRVTVTVSWTEPESGAHTVALDTLIAAHGGLP